MMDAILSTALYMYGIASSIGLMVMIFWGLGQTAFGRELWRVFLVTSESPRPRFGGYVAHDGTTFPRPPQGGSGGSGVACEDLGFHYNRNDFYWPPPSASTDAEAMWDEVLNPDKYKQPRTPGERLRKLSQQDTI